MFIVAGVLVAGRLRSRLVVFQRGFIAPTIQVAAWSATQVEVAY
jgi:hypothetical protein